MENHHFVMAMNARSGSTWLVTLLRGQSGVAAYEELFYPRPVQPRYSWLAEGGPERFIIRGPQLRGARPMRIWRYLNEVETHRADMPVSGFKVNSAQLFGAPEMLPILAARRYRLVVLVRDNVFESSISQIVMHKNNVAHSSEPIAAGASYRVDPQEVVARIRRRRRWIAAIRAVRRLWPWPSVEVRYEDLVANQSAALASVLDCIGAAAPPMPVESPLKRRIDLPYDEVITNFSEVAEAMRSAGLGALVPTAGSNATGGRS